MAVPIGSGRGRRRAGKGYRDAGQGEIKGGDCAAEGMRHRHRRGRKVLHRQIRLIELDGYVWGLNV